MTSLDMVKRPVPRWKWLLGGAVVAIPLLLGIGLTRDPSFIPSMIVGHAVPAFDLEALGGTGRVSSNALAGKPYVVNFWASWCVSCREEHPVLIELGERAAGAGGFAVVGVNYRDDREAALGYLDHHGRFPYASGVDGRGRLGIDFGVYGMPETFFVDAQGVVRARHVGPLTDEAIATNLALIGAKP
jgi:cytochrome c biogenesis protein CcmG/thiol:disulfide interchange protein DsbE